MFEMREYHLSFPIPWYFVLLIVALLLAAAVMTAALTWWAIKTKRFNNHDK